MRPTELSLSLSLSLKWILVYCTPYPITVVLQYVNTVILEHVPYYSTSEYNVLEYELKLCQVLVLQVVDEL
jgi:hypothetical protein